MANKDFILADLYAFLQESFKITTIPETMRKQINRFILQQKFTPKEIARCVCYYEEVRGGLLDPLYGVWFVPNVREAANEYFKQLELDQQSQAAEAKKVAEYQDNNIIFNIKSLRHKKRQPKQLDINEVNVEGDASND